MGTQNKVPDAYLPDRGARKEKVIIGLSPGIDSRVAAYLLKIQKYDLIAVTVVPAWEDLGKASETIISCGMSEETVERLQSFSHQLGIPHFVVRIPGEFRDRVVERWISKRAQGEFADQCWDCHRLRMEFLHSKMKELGGKYLATGHFAKVFRQDAEGLSVVQTSNDERYDQSALLSRLPQEILHDLLLPLSDLQKKEVLKLAENFGVDVPKERASMFSCFPQTEETIAYMEGKLPERFRREGPVVGDDEERFEDHEGVFRHYRGEEIASKGDRQPLIFARYKMQEKKILVKPPVWFDRTKFLLRRCQVPSETPWTMPFRGVLMLDGKPLDGWFYPKSLSSCVVELDAPATLTEGEVLSVMKKKGKNARVLLTGEVCFVDEERVDERGEADAKVDYGLDF